MSDRKRKFRVSIELSFEEWMVRVNHKVQELSGLSVDDIDDYSYRADFDSGVDPDKVAVWALEGANFPFEEGPE